MLKSNPEAMNLLTEMRRKAKQYRRRMYSFEWDKLALEDPTIIYWQSIVVSEILEEEINKLKKNPNLWTIESRIVENFKYKLMFRNVLKRVNGKDEAVHEPILPRCIRPQIISQIEKIHRCLMIVPEKYFLHFLKILDKIELIHKQPPPGLQAAVEGLEVIVDVDNIDSAKALYNELDQYITVNLK